MSKIISFFSGEYRFLSNFWPCWIYEDGIRYPSVEHAYQAAKTDDKSLKIYISGTPAAGKAKQIGRGILLRPDWEEQKLSVMENLLRDKFSARNMDLRDKLVLTAPAELIEGNNWRDTFWGVCQGKGQNHLGKLLMQIRKELLS